MNPSVVNRKDIISRFKLRSNTINREVIPVEDTTVDYANNTITHKLKEIPHNLPLSISTRLPSINKSLHNLSETPYIYHLDQVLNSSEPKFKSNKQIQLCIYKVIEKPRSPPFLLYLLNKDAATNILYFPHFLTKKNIMDDARDKIDIIYTDFPNKPTYKGYFETDHNIYLFYERISSNANLVVELKTNQKWWWISMHEIINDHKALTFSIDRTVYSIFFKNPILITLYNNKMNKIEIPYVMYFGGYENYIAFIASFGLPKETPTSNLGPYYYFYTYHGAGRRAIWTQTRKSSERNGEIITQDEYGVHKRGGIVRFILFGTKIRYFLNREIESEDTSGLSQELAKNNPFIKSTLKLRDVEGKWAVNHDLAYIGAAFIKNDKYNDRKLSIQWAARDYYQQIPLTYHYVDTTEFSNISDKEIAKVLPFEYKTYNIE